jgi:thiol-disulfide isomerase/thioredoxin
LIFFKNCCDLKNKLYFYRLKFKFMKRKHVIPGLLLVCFLAATVTMISSCKKKNDEPEKVLGCMDATALNFNALANEDDGSCVVPEVKERSILLDFTATWCGPCGAQGIPMFEAAIAANKNEVVPLGCHNSDEMSNPTSEDMGNEYGVTSIPTLVAANVYDIWGSTAINNAVASNNATAPTANAIAIMTVSGSTISLKTQTKFFKSTSGDYYLASYFVENNLLYSQTSATPDPFNHMHVLRGVAAGTVHGELIASGSISAGKVVNKDYSVPVGSGWNMSNVYVALVIWKKVGTDWTFVNAWQSKAN